MRLIKIWEEILGRSITIKKPITEQAARSLCRSNNPVTDNHISVMHETLIEYLGCYPIPSDGINYSFQNVSKDVKSLLDSETKELVTGEISNKNVCIVSVNRKVAIDLLMFVAKNTQYKLPQVLYSALKRRTLVTRP